MARYSKKAGEKVEDVMHEMKQGNLTSGRSGKKVTSHKQAIAIGLSEARRQGAKVPKKKAAPKKNAAPKKTAKKYTSRKSEPRKAGKKSSGRKKSSGGRSISRAR